MSLLSNLVAHWKLNDDAADPTIVDSVGENYGVYKDSGGNLNTSTGHTAGKISGGLLFDGVSEYATFGKEKSLKAIRKCCSKYSGNPVLTVAASGFASVFKDGDTYYAWSGCAAVYRYTSADGKNWGSQRVVTGLVGGLVPSVWKEGSTWHMMYLGTGAGAYLAVRYATSSDGLAWTDHGIKISQGSIGQWDYDVNLEPWGIIKVNSTYYLWYETLGGGERKTGLATTTNLNGSWTKDENNPIFDDGRFCPWPFKYQGYYYLLIPHSTSGTDYADIELYKCSTPTFYPVDRKFVRIVVESGAIGAWDDIDTDTPCLLTDNINRDGFDASGGEMWMYYAGNDGSDWRTGMVIETDPREIVRPHHLSVTLWFKWSVGDWHCNNKKMISWGEAGTRRSWFITTRTDGLIAFGGSFGYMSTSVTNWADGDWHFLVVTFDMENTHIYIDNVDQDLTKVALYPRITSSDEPLCIGGESDDGAMENFFYDGALDSVMLFDKVLSPAEVSYLWNSGNGRENVPDLRVGALVG